jgi:hypothetical protein
VSEYNYIRIIIKSSKNIKKLATLFTVQLPVPVAVLSEAKVLIASSGRVV